MPRREEPLEATWILAKQGLNRGHTLAVLGAGLMLRLVVACIVLFRLPPKWLFGRGVEMGLLAKSILAGQGLSSPFGGETGPTAFVAPVYPIFIAAVFKLFGPFSTMSAAVILAIQIGLNLLTIWLIMYIGRRLFNQATATVGGLLWACSPPIIWLPTIFWETSFSCCLMTGLLALVLRYRDEAELCPNMWLGLGAYCGFAALINPALLPSLSAIVLWTAFERRRQTKWHPLLTALVFCLVFAPWPIRNARVFHAFVPTRTTVGFELWMGNREHSSGFLDESVFPMFNAHELAEYKRLGEVEYTRQKSVLAQEYISSHRLAFLRMSGVRAVRFWSGTGTQNGSMAFLFHAAFTTLAGFSGLLLLARSRRLDLAILFSLPLLFFPLPYVITHAEFRYRLVVDPLLAIFSGYAVTQVYCMLTRENHAQRRPDLQSNHALVHES